MPSPAFSSPLRTLAGPALALTLSAGLSAQSSTPDGFLTGLPGFEGFHEPIGQPIYFESPFNDTGLRFIYLRHEFGEDSALQGGDLSVYAVQARLALTERLGLIATKDGYSELDAGIAEDEGWNDLAAGLKYVFVADTERDLVVTGGFRYQADNGTKGVLQGGVQEVSPFVSAAKGYGDLHVLGSATLRLPLDDGDGNTVGHWDFHADYDLNPGASTVFAPVVEVHGVHYLEDGDSALPVGGLDYTNLGSTPAEDFVAWAGIGFRVEFSQKYELGFVYEFALTDPDEDIMDQRVTVDFHVRW